MDYNKFMHQALSALLEEGEALQYPLYGTLLEKRRHWFGFFGLTQTHLLIALLDWEAQHIAWTSRVPLEIKEVTRRKCIFPGQCIVNIQFHRGNPCKIRFSEKVQRIERQHTNLTAFVAFLQEAAHERI